MLGSAVGPPRGTGKAVPRPDKRHLRNETCEEDPVGAPQGPSPQTRGCSGPHGLDEPRRPLVNSSERSQRGDAGFGKLASLAPTAASFNCLSTRNFPCGWKTKLTSLGASTEFESRVGERSALYLSTGKKTPATQKTKSELEPTRPLPPRRKTRAGSVVPSALNPCVPASRPSAAIVPCDPHPLSRVDSKLPQEERQVEGRETQKMWRLGVPLSPSVC